MHSIISSRDQVDVRFDDIGDQKVPSSLNSEEPVDFFSIDGSPGRNRVNSVSNLQFILDRFRFLYSVQKLDFICNSLY